MKKIFALISVLILTACATTEQSEFSDEEIRQMEEVRVEKKRINQVFETLCGEYSKGNEDCKKAARDVCKDHKVHILKVNKNVSCETKDNEFKKCGKITFTCKETLKDTFTDYVD